MKPVILIISCRRDEANGYNAAIRKTWAGTWKDLIDYRFVIAKSVAEPWEPKHEDILMVNTLDGYNDLSRKVYEAVRWAKEQGYTHAFKCDTDTYVHVPRLLASNFDRAPYIGNADSGYCIGGAGYWLNPNAIQKFVGSMYYQYNGCEDINVSMALQQPPNSIRWTYDNRYFLWHTVVKELQVGPLPTNDYVTTHLARAIGPGHYNVQDMYDVHKIWE